MRSPTFQGRFLKSPQYGPLSFSVRSEIRATVFEVVYNGVAVGSCGFRQAPNVS